MDNFILSECKFNNHTMDELLNIAEYTDNHLAIHLYNEALEESKENNEIQDKLEPIENTVLHLINNPKWIKQGNQSQGIYWYLDGFNIDTSIHHHSVRIESIKDKQYMVIIQYDEYGETMHDQRIDGLANAKQYAIDWSIKYALRNLLTVS